MVSVIYVARHGLRANAEPSPTGIDGDPKLTEEGLFQATELGQYVSNPAEVKDRITAIYSSPFYRCIQTAVPASKLLNVPIWVERGLSEYYVPSRPNIPVPLTAQQSKSFFEQIDVGYASQVSVSRSGETRDNLRGRVKSALDAIVDHAYRNGHEAILIITHAAIKITIAEVLCGEIVRSGTCSLDKITSTNNNPAFEDSERRWKLDYNGDTHFLSRGEQMHWSFDMAVEAGSAADEASRLNAKDIPGQHLLQKKDSEAPNNQKKTIPVLVSLDVSALAPADRPETLDPAKMHFAKMGTDRPIVQIGDKIYEGEWQRVVGTELYTNNSGEPLGTGKHRIKLSRAQIEIPLRDRRPLLERLPKKNEGEKPGVIKAD